MCDSFPAISAEQLTKAVSLAAAGTLSALDGAEEEASEQGNARDEKSVFDNDASKEVPSMRKSSLQLLECLPVSRSPKLPLTCDKEIAPSTSFYGRARKISTKKKLSEGSVAASSGKKYSSRKNYKLAPPLIPNEVRSVFKDVGAQMLLNSQVVKISHASSSNLPLTIQANRGINTTVGVRPITVIHSPQLPQNVVKNSHPKSNSLLSSILQSSPGELSSQMSPVQKLHTDGLPKTMINTSSSSFHTEPLTIKTEVDNKLKTPQFIPLTKSDSVFRVPFPVTLAQTASTPLNTLQIIRLAPTSLNSNNLSISNIGSSSQLLPIASPNQVPSQIIFNKDKPKSAINSAFLSHLPINIKSSHSSTVTCVASTAPSQVVTSSSVSVSGVEVPVVSIPKSLAICQTIPSSTLTKHNVITNEKTVVLGSKAMPIISLSNPINLSSFTQQLISPGEKTVHSINPQLTKSSSLVLTQSTSRYVNIRPSLIFPKDAKLPTIMSSNVQVRPVFIVTSANNNNLPIPVAKMQSNQATSNVNPGVVFVPSTFNSVANVPNTTQSHGIAATPKLQHSLPEVKNAVVPKQNLDRNGNSTCIKVGETAFSSSSLLKTSQNFSPLQILSPLSSGSVSDFQSSTTTLPPCQTLNLSTSFHSISNLTRSPNINLGNCVQSVAGSTSSTCSFSQPVLLNSQSGSTYCVSSSHAHLATMSGLNSSKNKPVQTLPITTTSLGPVIPRMPLTVVKDPFTPRSSHNQGTVRLAVYPLPPGFNLASNNVLTKASLTSTTTESHLCHTQPIILSSLPALTNQSAKDEESFSSSSGPSVQSSSCTTTTVTENVTNASTNPLAISSNTYCTASESTRGNQHLSESEQSQDVNGRKLVISPAGINQLQLLLRKMGTSEGYFIISTPRSAAVGSQQKPLSLSSQGINSGPVVSLSSSQQSSTTFAVCTSNVKCSSVLVSSPCISSVTSNSSDIHCSNVNSSPNQFVKINSSCSSLYGDNKMLEIGGNCNKDEVANTLSEEVMSDVETEGLEGEEDSDDGDTSSSAESTCSSNTLVIETNDQIVDSLNSSKASENLEDMTSSHKDMSNDQSKEAPVSHSTQSKSISGDVTDHSVNATVISLDSNLSSPLSLNEIVRQHQYKYGIDYQPLYSPTFANSKEVISSVPEATLEQTNKGLNNVENSEIRFPVPESPLGTSHLLRHNQQHHSHQQQSQTDNEPIYDQSLNTPHTLYTHHDQVNEIHMHNSSDIEAAMNLQRLSECPAPPPPTSSSVPQNPINTTPNAVNVTSPKSPLSINSSHPVEPHTPLHPPMTPNTMLINLLNRVPTPLLTNHQDLLTVPSSQENEIHFQGEGQSLESSANKRLHIGKQSSSDLQENLESTSKGSSTDILYNANSHSVLSDNAGSFGHTPQNALDLIASNYLPSKGKEIGNAVGDSIQPFSNPGISSQNFALSWHQGNNTLAFSTPEYSLSQYSVNETPTNVDHTLNKSDHNNHCKSCCLPITITINLDSNTVSVSNANNATENHQTVAEPHHIQQNFNDHNHQLPQQQGVLFDGFAATNNSAQEKCPDADIIRHLIMNTCSKNNPQIFTETSSIPPFDTCNPPLQNCHYEHRTQDSFLPSGDVASNMHCSVSESTSHFGTAGTATFHQGISIPESLSQENCHESFNSLSNSDSLIYDNNSSYENVQMDVTESIENCSFDINSSTSMATYRTSANSVYDSSQNPIFINPQNSTNSSFIMSSSLSDIHSSFDTETSSGKDQMSLHPPHIQSDGKLTQSSKYATDMGQNELFFHQSSTSESHPSNLHLYDMNSLHDSSHEMGYPMSGMENHDNQLQSHQECLQSSHCSNIQTGMLTNQCDLQGRSKQLQDHPFDFSIQQNHQYSRDSINQTGSDAAAVTYSDNQANLGGYINEPFSSNFYTISAGSNIPMFSQPQCAVGSEAPLMDSSNLTLNCSLPSYKNTGSDMQLEFHYQPQDDSAVVEKQLVLPSASFSPPSVADPAVTPDPGTMEIYNGSFQNLSAYDTYLRGGQSESRAQLGEPSPEAGKFCVECNVMYKNQCKFHPCECMDISDAPILSHARLTLPPCLKLGPSAVAGHTNKTGVFAKETVAFRTKFGPLVGSPVSCDQLGSTRSFSLWQTFVGSNVKVIDTSDENSSNWLMFVKPACVSSEQNLVAFQHGNRVFFVTRTEVVEGEELRYWFSKDYARMLGISSKPKNAQHQLCPHCPICKQVFADRKQVRSHIRIQHPKPQVNKCSHCSKHFSQVSHLNAHVLAVHLNVKKFVCDHCNKRFGDSSNLRKHIKSHSDERNFKCQICSKAFRQKAHLQVHMNSHIPVKHEQCRFCGNRFTRAFERKQHELQHTKQNRIDCQHCGKVFYKQKIFKEHMKIHRNERNFPCSHCGKAFRNKFALTRHGPACKQRKRGLSLAAANTTTNDILSRHLVSSSSSHASPIAGSSTNFSTGTDEDLSMNSTVSSSGLSNDV